MTPAMNRYLRDDRERSLADKADALAKLFAERAPSHDADGTFPFENFADLRREDFMKLTVPKEFGGDGCSLYELVLVQERLARGDGSTALAFGWHIGLTLHLGVTRKWPERLFRDFCRDVVRDGAMINSFASEPATGSPSRGGRPETKAVREGAGYRIAGRKTFSTLSPILDRFTVTAHVLEDDTVCEFLVKRTEGVEVAETWNTLGMRATGSHDVVLNEVYVPEENRLIDRGVKPSVDDGGGWMLHIPACYLGIAEAAREFAVKFALDYRPNSLPGPIADLPTIQQKIGAMEADLRTARLLLYEAAERWDKHPEERAEMKPELGLAKYAVTNGAIRIVDAAMRIVGGGSLAKALPLERYYRDVRAGLHNPPMDDVVLRGLAESAYRELRTS